MAGVYILGIILILFGCAWLGLSLMGVISMWIPWTEDLVQVAERFPWYIKTPVYGIYLSACIVMAILVWAVLEEMYKDFHGK